MNAGQNSPWKIAHAYSQNASAWPLRPPEDPQPVDRTAASSARSNPCRPCRTSPADATRDGRPPEAEVARRHGDGESGCRGRPRGRPRPGESRSTHAPPLLVTGAASGIGRATSTCSSSADGDRRRLHDADVVVDLRRPRVATSWSRRSARRAGARSTRSSPCRPGDADGEDRRRQLLRHGRHARGAPAAPRRFRRARAVATASMASLFPPDDALLDALLAGDESAAMSRAAELEAGRPSRGTSSTARRSARSCAGSVATPRARVGGWASRSTIAPGVVVTPMTQDLVGGGRDALLGMVPLPLNGIFEPRDCAYLLAWLTSEENPPPLVTGPLLHGGGGPPPPGAPPLSTGGITPPLPAPSAPPWLPFFPPRAGRWQRAGVVVRRADGRREPVGREPAGEPVVRSTSTTGSFISAMTRRMPRWRASRRARRARRPRSCRCR